MGFLTGRSRTRSPAARPLRRREFEGAQITRLLADWLTSPTTTDDDLRRGYKHLLARSRDLAENNPYARRFLLQLRDNVVGPDGIRMRPRATLPGASEPDEKLRMQTRELWDEWTHREFCTVETNLDWIDLQELVVQSVARDGQIFLRVLGNYRNPFGFAVEPIEASVVDPTLDQDLANGNRIRLGAERPRTSNRIVAWWFLTDVPGSAQLDTQFFQGRRYVRIPAEDIIQIARMDSSMQTHGYPWLASSMTRIRHLGGYEEAELVASRVAAAKMAFFKTKGGDGYDGAEDEEGRRQLEAEPGLFEQVGEDFELVQWDPQHPNTAFAEFEGALLRGIAAGANMTYSTLANDLRGASLASGRIEMINERGMYRGVQRWLVRRMHDPIFRRWLDIQVTAGRIDVSMGDVMRARKVKWQPRGWPWVDPMKDASAARMQYGLGATTLERIVGEATGEDIEEVFEQIRREREMARELGIPIDTGGGTGDLFGTILAASQPAPDEQ